MAGEGAGLGFLGPIGTGLNIADKLGFIDLPGIGDIPGISSIFGNKGSNRNIGVSAFNFGTKDLGALEPFRELGTGINFGALNIPEFRQAGQWLLPRQKLAQGAVSNVLSALKRLGLNDEVRNMGAAIKQAKGAGKGLSPTAGIRRSFQLQQQLFNLAVRGESRVQEAIGKLGSQEQIDFRNLRETLTARALLPQFQARFKTDTNILGTQQFTQSGDPVVKVLAGGQEVPFIAGNEPFNTLSREDRMRTSALPAIRNRITSFKGALNRPQPTKPQPQKIDKKQVGKVAMRAARSFLRFPRSPAREPRAFRSSGFVSRAGYRDISELEQDVDRIIPSGFISKQPTTQSRALALRSLS